MHSGSISVYRMFRYSTCRMELVIFIHVLIHLCNDSGLYIKAEAVPTSYQNGIPSSILPEPPGAIVVEGVKVTERVFEGSVSLRRLELLETAIRSAGKKAG